MQLSLVDQIGRLLQFGRPVITLILVGNDKCCKISVCSDNILLLLKIVTKIWVLQRYVMPYDAKDQRDTLTPPS